MMAVYREVFMMACLVALLPTQACAKQAPQQLATSSAVAEPRSPIGTGLDGLNYWNTEHPFLDVFKSSSPWLSGNADDWEDPRPLDLDEHGWVKSLRPGQRAITLMLYGWVDGVPRFPTKGQYIVEYEGKGTLEYSWAHVVESSPGRDVIELDPSPGDGLALIITSTNPRDYIRNIRVMMPNSKPGELFNPAFVESIRGYKAIRCLGWMVGSDAGDYAFQSHTWEERTTHEHARWKPVRHGAPIEVMVELCNRVDADPWFNIPHLADDEYVRRFAELLRDSLDPALKVYVEHSNEVWNGSYAAQYEYAARRGMELGCSTDPDQARQRYHARRTREIGAIFRKILGRDRVVVVLATQADVPAISEEMLGWDNTAAEIDALATAPYFGYELGLKENEARVAKMSLDELFRELETKVIPEMNSYTEQQAAIARKYGVPCISYEGGQHLANLEGGASEKVEALFTAANRDPRMGRIYTKYIEDWNRITSGQLWMHLMACGEAGKAGRWGALEYLGQPRSEAPKYDAIQKWMEGK